MLQLRLIFILGFILAFLFTTASAGRQKKPHSPPPTCENQCLDRTRECIPTCKDSKYARHPIACKIACECQVSKAVAFCRKNCEYDCKGDWPPEMGDMRDLEE